MVLGKVGFTLNSDWCEPKDPSNPADVEAAERAMLCKLGWFADPVYGSGDYPDVFKQQIKKASEERGVPYILPQFTPEDIALNKGERLQSNIYKKIIAPFQSIFCKDSRNLFSQVSTKSSTVFTICFHITQKCLKGVLMHRST